MFSTDPTNLRHIPLSEYRKRRAYWQAVQKASRPSVEEGPGGVTIEHSQWRPEEGAVIVE